MYGSQKSHHNGDYSPPTHRFSFYQLVPYTRDVSLMKDLNSKVSGSSRSQNFVFSSGISATCRSQKNRISIAAAHPVPTISFYRAVQARCLAHKRTGFRYEPLARQERNFVLPGGISAMCRSQKNRISIRATRSAGTQFRFIGRYKRDVSLTKEQNFDTSRSLGRDAISFHRTV